MKITLLPGSITGEVTAIPSKSHLHRLLIYAAFADRPTLISCGKTAAEDIKATMDCLVALGAEIGRNEEGFSVTPIDRYKLPIGTDEKPVIFPCGESGSTFRFMLPVVCALGIRGAFELKGRLPQRPLAPLDEQLKKHGVRLWCEVPEVLHCDGQLEPADDYFLPGDISSQYISGLLMALPLLEKQSVLTVSAPIESAGYIEMTIDAAKAFGQAPEIKKNLYDETQNNRFDSRRSVVYKMRGVGAFSSPGRIDTEGDWSNAAFWLCAGAMPKGNIKISGLSKNSIQGDRAIFNIINRMGALIEWGGATLTVQENARYGTEVDARPIPDLVPAVAAIAAVSEGTTIIENAARLRIKESDRLMAISKTLSTLGADIRETADGLIIEGVNGFRGGTIDAHGDHRIAMMAAIASAASAGPVSIIGAHAVNKSYPNFWRDLEKMGKTVIQE